MPRRVQITVRGAKLMSKATPYCVCTLMDDSGGLISAQQQKTKVVQTSCTNPVWEQTLEFDVPTDFYGFKLEVYNKRKLRADKQVGQVVVKVNPEAFYEQEINDEWLPLTHKGEQRGEMQLRVTSQGKPDAPPSRTNSNVTSATATPTTPITPTTPTTPTQASAPASPPSLTKSASSSSSSSLSTPTPVTSSPVVSSSLASSNTNTSDSTHMDVDSTVPVITTSSSELVKSPSWEHPKTTENLLKRSYVIIEEDFASSSSNNENDDNDNDNENDNDDSDTPAPPKKSTSRAKLTTSFKPSSDEDEDMEDEDQDEEEEEHYSEKEEEFEEEDYEDKDYMDGLEEEEAPIKPKSLSASGIFMAREAKITKVKDILGVPSHIAQALLSHFQWDEEKFLMRFLENPAAIYKEAKIEAPKEHKDGATSVANIACSVCFEDNQDEITALACNHYFCNDCWKTHIEVAMKEGRSLDITCMQLKCKELMPDYIVRKIVDLDTYKKYSAFLSKGFVENNANMKWCPKAGCTNAIDASQAFREGKCLVAKCECGNKFCFLCSEESHTPATCNMMKEWAKKCADDSETYNWIAANTKDCPQKNCGVPIEKNDGCFMMTCQKCRYQFCWLCCESWASHNDHFRCNKYTEGKLENKPSWMDGRSNTDARQALDRYLFYYNRYINHMSSLKFEDKSRETARNVMESLQRDGSHSFIDVQFIETALNQLLESRRTLKNTYIYAFYQTDPLKKDLFEFSQADLEKITEKIAQLLKENPENLIKAASTVKSYTQIAKQSLNNLLYDENL